jgi:hypothetical protein
MLTLTRAARPMGIEVGDHLYRRRNLRLVAPVGRASLVPRGQTMEETLRREYVNGFLAQLSDANLLLILEACVAELKERHAAKE